MKKSNKLTHFDHNGKAIMVDISNKEITERIATAAATIKMGKKTFEMIKKGTAKKGDVLGVARIAGIMAAKNIRTNPIMSPYFYFICINRF